MGAFSDVIQGIIKERDELKANNKQLKKKVRRIEQLWERYKRIGFKDTAGQIKQALEGTNANQK